MIKVKAMKSAEEGRGSGVNAKRSIKPEHFRMALEGGSIGRDNPRALVTSAYIAFTLGMGCRAVSEVHMVRNKDLQYGPTGKHGVPQWIELGERVTKTRKGRPNDTRILEAKVFPDHDNPKTCYVRTLLCYNDRRTEAQRHPDAPFFINCKQSAVNNPEEEQFWYIGKGVGDSGIMGKHTLGSLLCDALTAVGVDCTISTLQSVLENLSCKEVSTAGSQIPIFQG